MGRVENVGSESKRPVAWEPAHLAAERQRENVRVDGRQRGRSRAGARRPGALVPRQRVVCSRSLRFLRAPCRDPAGRQAFLRRRGARGGRADQEQLPVCRLPPGTSRARQPGKGRRRQRRLRRHADQVLVRAPGGAGQSYLLSIALIVSSRLRRMRLKDRANTPNSSLPDSGSSGTALSALLVLPMLSRSAAAETLLTGRTLST